jgi:hypothetical protein
LRLRVGIAANFYHFAFALLRERVPDPYNQNHTLVVTKYEKKVRRTRLFVVLFYVLLLSNFPNMPRSLVRDFVTTKNQDFVTTKDRDFVTTKDQDFVTTKDRNFVPTKASFFALQIERRKGRKNGTKKTQILFILMIHLTSLQS